MERLEGRIRSLRGEFENINARHQTYAAVHINRLIHLVEVADTPPNRKQLEQIGKELGRAEDAIDAYIDMLMGLLEPIRDLCRDLEDAVEKALPPEAERPNGGFAVIDDGLERLAEVWRQQGRHM